MSTDKFEPYEITAPGRAWCGLAKPADISWVVALFATTEHQLL